MSDGFLVVLLGIVGATLRYATPLTLAALGGLFSERAGVVNIALEGMMIAGAFFAIFGADVFGSWVFGLLSAMVAGTVLALLHAFACIHLRADQIVIGTAILLIAAGLIDYLNLAIYGAAGSPPDVSRVIEVRIPGLGDMSLLIPLTVVLIAATAYVIFRTPFGLHLRAVGEHPRAADTVGIPVYRIRYIGVLLSGAFAGLAGAYISMGVGSYTQGMTGGRGFIALAALIFGKWNPWGAFAASLLFGFAQAVGDQLQNAKSLPSALTAPELVTALPYVITLIALAGFVGRAVPPAAVGKPYAKG